MKEEEMKQIGGFITRAIDAKDDSERLKQIRQELKEFCKVSPVY